MPFCSKCGEKFKRQKMKGAIRSNSKICDKCKKNQGRKTCLICGNPLKKKVGWQIVCPGKCRKAYDKQRSEKWRKLNAQKRNTNERRRK